jgi:hypothetical protein
MNSGTAHVHDTLTHELAAPPTLTLPLPSPLALLFIFTHQTPLSNVRHGGVRAVHVASASQVRGEPHLLWVLLNDHGEPSRHVTSRPAPAHSLTIAHPKTRISSFPRAAPLRAAASDHTPTFRCHSNHSTQRHPKTHTHTHTHTRTHAHTHTHTHTLSFFVQLSPSVFTPHLLQKRSYRCAHSLLHSHSHTCTRTRMRTHTPSLSDR